MTGGRDRHVGTPQGGVVSPLLSNIYMNRFLKHWRLTGRDDVFQARVISYADDFVILSRGHASEALAWTRSVMMRLGLTLNEAKTSVKDAPPGELRFPGLHVRPASLPQGWPLVPGRKPVQEERTASQGEDRRPSGARQPKPLADGLPPAEQATAWLVGLLRLWHAVAGLSGCRQPRLRERAPLPRQAAQGARTRYPTVSLHGGVRTPRRAASETRACWAPAVGLCGEAGRKAGCGKPARPV